MEFFALSDVGLIRDKNQDSYITCENSYGDFLAIVADGIGGGPAGEIASSILVKYFFEEFRASGKFDSLENVIDYFGYHIAKANKRVYDTANKYKEYTGMGTTLTGIFISKDLGQVCFNCGDSRVYGLSDNDMTCLTTDDTLINKMLSDGEITPEEAINHPKKHYLTRAMGIYKIMEAEVRKCFDYEYYLVCSDGLHSYVSEQEIKDIVFNEDSLQEKVTKLKDLSLLKGGTDNVSIILIKK